MTVSLCVVLAAGSLGLYAYVGYPAILWCWAQFRDRPAAGRDPSEWPLVTIVLPAYNEERAIAATIDTLLALDYPADRRFLLVVSDASTDRTDEIVRGYEGRGVRLLRLPVRGGKTAAENASFSHVLGDIVVNTDASVRIRRDALKPLIRAFGDPSVGVASGRDISVARVEESANVGESGYVGYEMAVRALETRVDSIVGASGCFYGIRRSLHEQLVPEALSRDFSAALTARVHGFRAISVDDAVCFVPRSAGLHQEFRRKVRTFARGMETLYYRRSLLNPLRFGRFSWMLASHKVCRWSLPWAGAAGLVALAGLAMDSQLARWAFAVSLATIALGVVGWYWPAGSRMPRVVSLPAFALWGNLAVMKAGVQALRGELNPIWEPTRRTEVQVR